MKSKTNLFIAILILTLAVSACGGGSGEQAQLQGTSWLLVSYAGTPSLSEFTPTLHFEADVINGNAGCNDYGGGYEINGDEIQFDALYATEMFCMVSEEQMVQESSYLQMLGDAQSFSLDGSSLTILTAAGEEMIFTPASE